MAGAAPDFGVKGLNVVITGGTGGIGMAFARAFTGAGATAVVTDVKPYAGALPDGVSFEKLDVCSDADVAALAAKLPKVDVLIHCAGRLVRMEEFKIDTFKQIVDIHLFGAMRLSEALRPKLAASGRGSIILIGSMYSYFGSAMIPAYTAAKTAIVGLTRSLAVGYAAAGDPIRVNCIAPGWINTDISRRGREDPVFNPKVMDRLPTKRWSEPDELAGTAVFLASPAAKLINGVTIPVDGGYVAS